MRRIAFNILGRDLSTVLIYSCSSIGNIASVIQIILLESLLMAVWWPLLLMALQRVSAFAKLSGPGSVFYFLRVSLNLVLPTGQP